MIFTLGCRHGNLKQGKLSREDSLRVELENLNKQISGSDKNAELLHQRAELYVSLKEINQALNDINKALQIDPKKADYYITLSDIYLLMGQPQNCEESLQKAVSVDPNSVNANLKLANLYLIVKDYKKLDQYTREVLQLDKSNSAVRFTRAMGFLENGDTALAIGDLMDAVKYNQQYFDAYLLLGELFATRKDPLASGYFNNALRIRPSSKEALYDLGMFYQESSQYAKAIGTYEVLRKVDTMFRDAPYNIGYINLVYLQDYNQAIMYFSKAISIDPKYAEAWYNRGLSYEQLKEYQKAYDDYQKSLKLKVNFDKAVTALNRLDQLMKK